MCQICGQPGFIRCNCVSAQPFCDQCTPNSVCAEKVDSQCVIYHFAFPGYIPPPSRLINLGLPNGSSAETIFEKIDSFFGAGFFRPWTVGDTATLDLELDGPSLPVVLKGNVNVSAASGNTLIINPDGLAVIPDYKVKVDPTTIPRYLEDTMIGGTDGCVSISVDDIGGLLNIQPLLDIQCLADRICNSSGNTKVQLGVCLIDSSLVADDSNSIDLDITEVGSQLHIIANSKISASSGNTIVINPDGLFAPGGGVVTGANNGLSLSGTNAQLGGTLIKNTSIDFGSAFQLNFINKPLISIGSAAALTTTTVFINDSTAASIFPDTLSVNQERNLTDATGFISFNAFLKILGGPFTQGGTTFNAATAGQLWLSPSGDLTLNNATNNIISGVYGTFIKSGSHNVTGNIVSGGQFQGFAADSGNVTSMASIRLGGLNVPPPVFGGAFTGTVTNYYGAYFEDISASAYAANITNKYAIFQAGTTALNVFSTAVTVSDVRKKENILTFTKGLAEIDQLRIVEFNFIDSPDKSDKKVGVIAQEVEAVLPEAIKTRPIEDLEDFKLVESNVIFYTMLNAIKELSAQNKNLSDRILALEAKNS